MTSHLIDPDQLPSLWPTHRHESAFWEQLGRTIATFGLLEEVLGRAVFALTATQPAPNEDVEVALNEWLKKLERALNAPLGGRVKSFKNAAEKYPGIDVPALTMLIESLTKASAIRDILCHASWQVPDENGASIPRYVDNKLNVFESPIDVLFLDKVQKDTVMMICDVMNTVAQLGCPSSGILRQKAA